MRILVLSTWFPYPPDNGSRIRAYYLVRALSRVHDVTLIAFRLAEECDHDQSNDWPANMHIYPVCDDPFRYVNRPQIVKFVSPIPLAYWPNRAMQHAVADVATQNRWDAVIAIQPPVAQYACGLTGIPRVLDIDTALSYQMRERYAGQNLKGRATQFRTWLSWQKAHRYESRIFQQFQACTLAAATESDYVTSMVRSIGCPIEIVSNGVDCSHNQPGSSQVRSDTLIYNGALTYGANYDAVRYFLSQVYPHIQKQNADVSFTVTGSLSGVDLLGLQLDASVNLTGYVDDVRPYVASSAVCVVPIQHGGGTRLKILEAMALGTPVIATSKGVEGLEVRHDEHLLIADEPLAFAAGTQRLLHDVDLRRRLAANARRLVEQHYDWEHIGRRFVEIVESTALKAKNL